MRMKNVNIKKPFISKVRENIIVSMASIALIYLLISLYFINHTFFRTVINGVDISLKAYDEAEHIIRSYVKEYELQLMERNGEIEEITGQDIVMQYNDKSSLSSIYHTQNSLKWITPLFGRQKYYTNDLFVYDKEKLENKISELNCMNKVFIEPQDVSFTYSNGIYEVIEEVFGNKIIKDRLRKAIEISILKGQTKLDLNKNHCYENPRFTMNSVKTFETKNLLDKYVKAKIIYKFGNESETLDGYTINKWLGVDESLDVVIDNEAVMKYVGKLSLKYDTVGKARNFKTSIGKTVEVKGGLYGWRINRAAEAKALIENIKLGEVLEKEPIYTQKPLSRYGNEIGNTYVEINVTRQYLWFYKNGKLVARGAVVTGKPNKGYSTVLGIYMLNYKQKGATLIGADYESEVTYWMPFFG
ncbi:MAG TPA: peptidoglycan binding domain-containing protein, partial [Patescibacteria group bacterium]|nr:peptidoglycan binding domain-containing protein [Patescibacteria group bacterium]